MHTALVFSQIVTFLLKKKKKVVSCVLFRLFHIWEAFTEKADSPKDVSVACDFHVPTCWAPGDPTALLPEGRTCAERRVLDCDGTCQPERKFHKTVETGADLNAFGMWQRYHLVGSARRHKDVDLIVVRGAWLHIVAAYRAVLLLLVYLRSN